jgi:phosphatidylserine decarboxylase
MTLVRFDRAATPFVGGALVAAGVSYVFVHWSLALVLVLAGLGLLLFFRDPERLVPAGANLVVSPADGRVLVAGAGQPDVAPPGAWKQISIFLSPMDVHVNRAPVSGRVTAVVHRPGRFLPAYRPDSASRNERTEIAIDHDGQTVIARQVVGMLARRVVCRAVPGAMLRTGERYGIMKFGSRMDIFLPVSAEIRVREGEIVRGGESVIAVLH